MYVLPKALFRLAPDSHARDYANVSNMLSVTLQGREHLTPVQVNAKLFPLMRALGVPRDAAVTLYLDSVAQHFCFGLMINDTSLIDLWRYAPNQIPLAIRARRP